MLLLQNGSISRKVIGLHFLKKLKELVEIQQMESDKAIYGAGGWGGKFIRTLSH